MRNYALIFALLLTYVLGSCKKDKVEKATNVSNAQAATMVATALAINANGFVSIKNDVTLYAKNLGTGTGKGCGILDSSALARQEPTSSLVKYNYALGYHYMVNCGDGTVATKLTSSTTYNGSFDAATLTAITTTTCTLDITNLDDATAVNYLLTGNHQSSGSFQTIDETQLSGTNMIVINTGDLKVKKSNRGIAGGTAVVNVSGTVKNKNTFAFTGTLAFDNTGIARLVLDGVSYDVNLTTAEVIML